MNDDKKLGACDASKRFEKTHRLVLTGLLFALAVVLAVIESMLPPVPLPVPGVKFGLSNIAVMYTLFFVGRKEACAVAVLKSLFVFAVRGAVAAMLSGAGGLLSIFVMILLMGLFQQRISILLLSVSGAVAHNIGQFFVVMLLYAGTNMLPYLPILLLSGLAAGIVTASLLRLFLPALSKLSNVESIRRRES